MTITDRQARAIAYRLADEVETIADAIWQRRPRLSYQQCQAIALRRMAGSR